MGLFLSRTYSQEEDYSRPPENKSKPEKGKWTERLVIGGGAGAQFGNETYISLMPKVGYYFTEKVLAGVGFTYIYNRVNLTNIYGSGGVFETSIYGGSAFGQYFLLENLFAHIEPEFLNYESYNSNTQGTERIWLGSYFIGGGWRQAISKKGFIQIELLYNLNYRENSPYSSPWLPRISFFL